METTPAQSENQEAPESDKEHQSRIFEDPAIREAVAQDPLMLFIKDHWREFLIAVVAVVAWFWGSSVYTSTYETSMKHAAELYEQVQSEYAVLLQQYREKQRLQLEAEAEKAKAEEEGNTKPPEEEGVLSLEEKLKVTENSIEKSSARIAELVSYLGDAYQPYDRIGQLYLALTARLDGDLNKVESLLSSSAWKTEEPESRARYFSELSALVLARTLLDSPEKVSEGRLILKSLAEEGSFVHVSAALTYARTAVTDEEKSLALQVLEGLADSHPEQAELLDDDLSRLG